MTVVVSRLAIVVTTLRVQPATMSMRSGTNSQDGQSKKQAFQLPAPSHQRGLGSNARVPS